MKNYAFLLCTLLCCSNLLPAQNGLQLLPLATGFTSPLGIENCGDNRLFIVQKIGRITICDTLGNKITTPFLDISDRISLANGANSEQGLLGLAFDPKYATNGFFYVFYTNKHRYIQISRFKVSANPNVATAASEKKIMEIAKDYTYHNGGTLRFGPDGFLYIGVGDGGGIGDPENNAQNPSTLLGKMLRIDIHSGSAPYKIPPANPFVNTPGYKPEIWALGLRNPWRWSFDKTSGALFISDVGQSSWEEVNRRVKTGIGGDNYGWRCYEGSHPLNMDSCSGQTTYIFPSYEYPHSTAKGGDCCVIGGFVYRGKKYASMYGKYYFTDFCSGMFRSLTFQNNTATERDEYDGANSAYTSFGEDSQGELYIVNQKDSTLYRIAATNATVAAPLATASLIVYPNPAKGYCTVSYTASKAEACTLALVNATGVPIVTEKYVSAAGKNTWQLAIPAANKGTCYVMVTSASGNQIKASVLVQ